MLSRQLRQCSSTSLAYTSNFCCTSPCILMLAVRTQDVRQAGPTDLA